VVWLDDLQNYLDVRLTSLANENAAALRELIADPSRCPVLLAATIWPRLWQELNIQSFGFGLHGSNDYGQYAQPQVAVLLSIAQLVQVPSSFVGADLVAAGDAARYDVRLARAIERAPSGRLTQYLAGAVRQLELYETAPPEATAMINVAIDARRLGHRNQIPEKLMTAAEGYIDDADLDRLSDGWSSHALEITSAHWRGLEGPLCKIRPRTGKSTPVRECYRLADIIEQVGTSARQYEAPPEIFWTVITEHGHPEDLSTVARAAQIRGRYQHAMRLYARAARAGKASAADRLSEMLQKASHQTEAEKRAIKALLNGNNAALLAEAEACELAGDHKGAEMLYQMLAGYGNVSSVECAAQIAEDAGEQETADRLYEAASYLRSNFASRRQAEKRELAGDHENAARLYQIAADSGDIIALIMLAEMRYNEGDHERAERLAVKAANAGNVWALALIAEMRDRAGDHERAEWLRRFGLDADGNISKPWSFEEIE